MTRPLLLGHRGARASHHVRENTLASFELCLEHGCDGFEFDVRRSADGRAMICHDPVIRGMDIATTAAAVLGLSTLDEVIASFGSRAFLDIELKVGGLEQTVLALLREQPPQSGYVVSSFLPQVLSEIHSLDATVPLGFIFDNSSATEVWQRLPVDWVMPHVALADQSFVGRTHGAGKKVMVWTVNDADEIKKLAAWGADAIISDDTQLARRGAG